MQLFKGAGWLNILGMSAAFAALYIILVQVNHDLNFNRSIKDSERIYIVAHPSWVTEDHFMLSSNRPKTEFTLTQSSKIESFGLIGTASPEQSVTLFSEGKEGNKFKARCFRVSAGAIKLLGFEPVAGSFHNMASGTNVAISKRLATRMNAKIGDYIDGIDNNTAYTIAAIYKDMPANTEFSEIDLFSSNGLETENIDNSSLWGYRYFVKLYSNQDKESFESEANAMIKAQFASASGKADNAKDNYILDRTLITLLPINDLHFNQQIDFYRFTADKTSCLVLIGIAILILLITLINYVNFFLAQIPLRLRSVNTKKILGSNRLSLVMQFILESSCFVLIALLVSTIAIILMKDSSYTQLLSCSLALSENLDVVCITILIALFMTIAASVYPAIYITSFPVAMAIKGSMGSSKGNTSFQYILLGFQFVVTLVFVICSLLLRMEYNYMMDYDMGFNKESLYSMDLNDSEVQPQLLMDELKKSPITKDLTLCDSPIVCSDVSIMQEDENEYIFFKVAPNFLKFMGIKVTEGRDFTESDKKGDSPVRIFNEISKKKMDLKVGKDNVIGFCNNFHFQSLLYNLSPYAFIVKKEDRDRSLLKHIYIRTLPGVSYERLKETVTDALANVSHGEKIDNLSLKSFNDELTEQYQDQKNDMATVTLFSILAITISLMGIVGLLLFETTYRRKEIGIRKVHGAEISEILQMFNTRFVGLLFVCFAIAAPISYFIMDYYYSTFAYRAPLTPWIFIASFFIVLLITVVVVTVSTYKAASENPSVSLKSE